MLVETAEKSRKLKLCMYSNFILTHYWPTILICYVPGYSLTKPDPSHKPYFYAKPYHLLYLLYELPWGTILHAVIITLHGK